MEGVRDLIVRGQAMLRPVYMWWVPNRGLFRLAETRKIQGVKSHRAGDFSADWPWLFHMSLLGEFARVPETLCFKFYMPTSLSRNWERSGRQNYEVRRACMGEIRLSSLKMSEKLRLAAPLAASLLRIRLRIFEKERLRPILHTLFRRKRQQKRVAK